MFEEVEWHRWIESYQNVHVHSANDKPDHRIWHRTKTMKRKKWKFSRISTNEMKICMIIATSMTTHRRKRLKFICNFWLQERKTQKYERWNEMNQVKMSVFLMFLFLFLLSENPFFLFWLKILFCLPHFAGNPNARRSKNVEVKARKREMTVLAENATSISLT